MEQQKCLVLLSGGQDSATVALLAKAANYKVHGLTINYGQRHEIEIESAKRLADYLEFASHEVLTIGGNTLASVSSPLIATGIPVDEFQSADDMPDGVANTFIPARNALMLAIAANRAYELSAMDVFAGVCQQDYSGYPDCRESFIQAMEIALGEALYGSPDMLKIHTPLMHKTKAETVMMAKVLLGDAEFDHIFSMTHTCYSGVLGGCGKCAACLLRDRGFKEAGVVDPIWKHRKKEAIA